MEAQIPEPELKWYQSSPVVQQVKRVKSLIRFGGPGEIRTLDLFHAIEAQLIEIGTSSPETKDLEGIRCGPPVVQNGGPKGETRVFVAQVW